MRNALLLLALLTFPGGAQAYVDPGVIAALSQMLYVGIFGVFAALVFRPWNWFKAKFGKDIPAESEAGEEGESGDAGSDK